jgi:hypothetical protein
MRAAQIYKGLMRRFAFIAGFSVLLAGCGSADPPSSSSSPSPATSASASASLEPSLEPSLTPSPAPSASPPVSVPAVAKDGSNLEACADASCEVLIKGTHRVPMAKRFGIVEILLRTSSDQLEFYVDRAKGDDTSGWVGGTGYVSLADGIKITILRNDRRGVLLRFEPTG